MPTERIHRVLERIDSLSLRERAIVFVTALALVFLLWDATVFGPLDRKRVAMKSVIEETRVSVEKLNAQASRLAVERGADPDEAERRIVASLLGEISRINQALAEVTDHLVPPQDMARVLEAVLTRETALELLRLEGLGAEPVVGADRDQKRGRSRTRNRGESIATESASLESEADVPAGLYRHGLRLEFRGSYPETLKYLAALEGLAWRFLWDSVRYEVESFPRARVSIVVHSLSFDDAWIGV